MILADFIAEETSARFSVGLEFSLLTEDTSSVFIEPASRSLQARISLSSSADRSDGGKNARIGAARSLGGIISKIAIFSGFGHSISANSSVSVRSEDDARWVNRASSAKGF